MLTRFPTPGHSLPARIFHPEGLKISRPPLRQTPAVLSASSLQRKGLPPGRPDKAGVGTFFTPSQFSTRNKPMNNTTQPGAAPTGPATTNNAPAVKSVLRMGVFTLAMINVSAIVSLRGMPAESTYGLSSVFITFSPQYSFWCLFPWSPRSLLPDGPKRAAFTAG